jgi:hypothetical protein
MVSRLSDNRCGAIDKARMILGFNKPEWDNLIDVLLLNKNGRLEISKKNIMVSIKLLGDDKIRLVIASEG